MKGPKHIEVNICDLIWKLYLSIKLIIKIDKKITKLKFAQNHIKILDNLRVNHYKISNIIIMAIY